MLFDANNQKIVNLSNSQKQKVVIARALINNPNIIIADQPETFLDEVSKKKIFYLLESLSKLGSTIIITTNKKQFELSKSTKNKYEVSLQKNGFSKITTEIENFKNFYYAEEYHQQYLLKNPNGYCGIGGCNVSYYN